MFLEVLFIIAKMWKQIKCPRTDKWIKKWVYMYNRKQINYKKNLNHAICSSKKLESMLNKVRSEGDGQMQDVGILNNTIKRQQILKDSRN